MPVLHSAILIPLHWICAVSHDPSVCVVNSFDTHCVLFFTLLCSRRLLDTILQAMKATACMTCACEQHVQKCNHDSLSRDASLLLSCALYSGGCLGYPADTGAEKQSAEAHWLTAQVSALCLPAMLLAVHCNVQFVCCKVVDACLAAACADQAVIFSGM